MFFHCLELWPIEVCVIWAIKRQTTAPTFSSISFFYSVDLFSCCLGFGSLSAGFNWYKTKQHSDIQTITVILFRIEYIKSPLILLLRSYNMAEGLGNFLHLTNHSILALTLCLPNVSFGLPWCLSMNSRNVNKCIVNHVCLFAFLLKPHGVLTVGNGWKPGVCKWLNERLVCSWVYCFF